MKIRNRKGIKAGIALVGAIVVLAGLTQAALAHTSVAESNPEDGSSLEAAPAQVMVRFGQPELPAPAQISDARLEVFDACGAQVDKNDSSVNMQDSSVTVSSAGGVAGRYEIHWYATAADGEPQSGVLDFNVTSGTPCTKAARTDAEKDTELGADLLSVSSKVVKGGGLVTLKTSAALDCAAYGAETDDRLRLMLDTNSDRSTDFSGNALCNTKKGTWKLYLESIEGDETGSVRMAAPNATTLKVKLPKQLLVAHVDVWVESSSEAVECDGKVCFDRAPDLGLLRAY
ncbi:MAG TPA: copper resistance CopC family protein [Actinomycetota bacterium]|nr:copper resistance CopC family protein [Actinomycetota bacterium]